MGVLLWLGALVALSSNVLGKEVMVGEFTNSQHGVGGRVYLIDEKTLLIKGFTYDGGGPDAFFWAGTEGSPSSVGNLLPYPFEGKFYAYEDQAAPILSGTFSGEKDIKLTLPETLKSTDIKWLSVWCRAFSVNFGDVIFPNDLLPPHHSPKPLTVLPPAVLSPINNDLSTVHNTAGHGHDSDAEPETESEPELESETVPYNRSDLTSCTNMMVFIAASLIAMVM